MTQSRASRRKAYVALISIAVAVGFGLVIWPFGAGDGVKSLDEAAAEQEANPDEAVAQFPTATIETESDIAAAPQREALDEASEAGIADPLWIQVNDTDGNPAPMRSIAITSVGELPIWLVEEHHVTDRNGQVAFDRTRLLRVAKSNHWKKVHVGVWDWQRRGFADFKTVDLADTHELSLNVPSAASIQVQLIDVPAGLFPVIASTDGLVPKTHGSLLEDGQWLFSNIPLGSNWSISLVRGEVHPKSNSLVGAFPTPLPVHKFVGPHRPRELVQAVYRLTDYPIVQGRFVDELGQPLRFPKGTEPGMRVAAFGAHSEARDVFLRPLMLEGGEFLLIPPGKSTELASFSRVHFDWQPSLLPMVLQSSAGTEDARLHVVRSASLELPLGATFAQLGDIVLSAESHLLEVLVEDQAGSPVHDASVEIRFSPVGIRDDPSTWWNAWPGELLVKLTTDEDGRVQFCAPSWEDARAFGDSGVANVNLLGEILSVVAVEVNGYRSQIQLVPVDLRSMRIRLEPARELQVKLMSTRIERASLEVVAFPAGANPFTSVPLDRDNALLSNGSAELVLDQLPVGLVDLEVHYGPLEPWPIASVRKIDLRTVSEASSTGKVDLRLDPLMNWVELDMDPLGSDRSRGEASFTLEHPGHPDGVLRGRSSFTDGEISVPLPEGIGTWTGELSVRGYHTVQVSGLTPGRHRIDLVEAAIIELRMTRLPKGEDWVFILGEFGTFFDASDDVVEFPIEGPQTISCAWVDSGSDDEDFKMIQAEIVITAADIARGYAEITPPDDF